MRPDSLAQPEVDIWHESVSSPATRVPKTGPNGLGWPEESRESVAEVLTPPGRPPVLSKPVGIRALEDRARYFIACADESGGIMTTTQRHIEPRPMKGLVFQATDASMGPVEFHLQVISSDTRLSHGSRRAYRFQWLAITAREKRSYLVNALKVCCGVNARVSVSDDALGDHRVLVFDARQRQVRLVNVGESVLPPVGGRLQSATPSIRNGGDPERVRTQPRVLVDATTFDQALDPVVARHLGVGAPHERRKFDRASYIPTEATPKDGASKPMPLYSRTTEKGLLKLAGQSHRIEFGWVGHTHLAFSILPGVNVKPGNDVHVGVPSTPLAPELVWVRGIVSRMTAHRGHVLVEVDLRASGETITSRYHKLVDFFFHRAKDVTR